MTNLEALKIKIEEQKNINVNLYNLIPLAATEDPTNLKAEPILKKFREGSKKLRMLTSKLNSQLNALTKVKTKTNKTFINSFGEATNRVITNTTHTNANKRLSKEIMNFIS